MLFKLITEFLNDYITNATVILFIIISVLTLILIIIKFSYIFWQNYILKVNSWMKPIFEEYIKNPNNTGILPFYYLLFPNSSILHKYIVFRSFSETGKNFELTAEAYNALKFHKVDLRNLNSIFWWKRAEAARCLGQMRYKKAKPFLIEKLNDPVVEVRLIAAWSLGRIGDTDTILPSMEALVNASRLAGMRLSSTVFEIGEKAIPVLSETLHHSDPAVRLLALHLLGEMRAVESIPVIKNKTVIDEDKEVRIAAYKSLGTISHPSSLSILIEGLKDVLWEVRAQSARGLGIIGSDEVIEPLVSALEDQKWWVRRNAGEALFKLGIKGKASLKQVLEKSCSEHARDMALQWLNEYI